MSSFLASAVPLAAGFLWLWVRQIALRREAYIRSSVLPRGLFDQLRKRHPELTLKACQLVAHALRQFFLAHLKSGRKYVSMPSQIADELWHEFILYTKNYQAFCNRAFGRFLHHLLLWRCVAIGMATLAFAGVGGTPAVRRTSTLAFPPVFHCCSRWMPS